MKIRHLSPVAACFSLVLCLGAPAHAQQTYKIGVSAGLTGYAAAVDRSWRDGLEVAVDYVNSKGGVAGRQIVLKTLDDGGVRTSIRRVPESDFGTKLVPP